ncbi:DUF4185 domain-containing protein [Nocardia alni]|uniref:DUF4185 domain-containing protein n=1 Tax=Nocardia alni TaxID=2815723 RepID=UPI001C221A18|nr:DUF4185 domain-containing protein [Nocardia alni]
MSQEGTYLCDNAGDSASGYGLGSADLGIPYLRYDNTWGYVFGDSFTGQEATDPYIGSPVMLYQSAFDATGASPITFTWSQPHPTCAQLFNYQHNADNGFGSEVSRIPNDAITLNVGGSNRIFIQYTSVNQWVAPGSANDGSLQGGVAYSDDNGATWLDFPTHWPGAAQGSNGSLELMWSFAGVDPVDGYLYIFSKAWNGSHNYTGDAGRIQLFRYLPTDFFAGTFSARQNWAWLNGSWQWVPAAQAPASQLFDNGNNIGEFSVKRIGGEYVMSYFDCTDYSIRTRTAPRPDRIWTDPKTQVVGDITMPGHVGLPVLRNLYGGYIHPGSTDSSNLTLIISAWDGTRGDRPYTATQWSGIAV